MSAVWFSLLIIPLIANVVNIPFSNGHPWRVEFVAAFVLCAVFIYFQINGVSLSVNSKILTGFSLFIVWSALSATWAKSPISVAHHTFIWISYLFFFCIFLHFFKESEKFGCLLAAAATVLSAISILCLIDSFLLEDFKASEGAFRIRYAKYAELILTVAPIFWALSLQIRNRRTLFLVQAVGILLWLAVAFSLSKGAFLAGICSFIIFFGATLFFTKNFYNRRKTAVLIALWLIVTVASQVSYSSKPSTSQYITGSADVTRETSLFRIFTWQIGGQMISDNLLLGVGADNFGQAFNESRAEFNLLNPEYELADTAETYLVERAHNEAIQIAAELGLVGIVLFAGLIGAFFLYFARAFVLNGYKFSPLLWSCIAGMSGFFVSSMFSSFSFRAIQNGIVFFLVLALAAYETEKIYRRKRKLDQTFEITRKPFVVLAFGSMFLFFGVSLSINLSNYFLNRASLTKELAIAEPDLRKSLAFNPFSASANYSYGMRLFYDRQSAQALPFLEKAVRGGLDTNINYYNLAAAYDSAGDSAKAAAILDEAVRIYPRSILLRVRYALLLQKLNQREASEKHLQIARAVDEKQTTGWFELMTTGARSAALKSRAEKTFPEPMDLSPNDGIYAVIGEHFVGNFFPEDFARNQ